MGLDMYLTGRRGIAGSYMQEPQEDMLRQAVAKATGFDEKTIRGIELDLAYWRKANAVHKWFVDVVQEGVDDCDRYYVTRKQLQELQDLAYKGWKERDPSYLPPTEGFFFGSTDIDDYYYEQLKYTYEEITNILENHRYNDLQFFYRSSW